MKNPKIQHNKIISHLLVGFLILMIGSCEGRIESDPSTVNLNLRTSFSRINHSVQKNALGTVADIIYVTISVYKVSDSTEVAAGNLTESLDVWEITLNDLPADTSLRFTCNAYDSSSQAIFRGEIVTTLTYGENNDLAINMESIDDASQPSNPKIISVIMPEEILIDSTADVTFTISHTGVVNYTVEVLDGTLNGMTNSTVNGTDFDPSTDLNVSYYAPSISGQDSITLYVSDPNLSDVIGAIFPINVVDSTETSSNISVLFGPVISGMNFQRTSDSLKLEVQIESSSDSMTYSWMGSGSFSSLLGVYETNGFTINPFSDSDSGDISVDVEDENGIHASLVRGINGADFPYVLNTEIPSGTLIIDLIWPDETFEDDADIKARLKSLDGSEEYNLEFTVSSSGATYTGSFATGYYFLDLDIWQNSGYKCLNSDKVISNGVLQIISNTNTSETYTYSAEDFEMEQFLLADEPPFNYGTYSGIQELEYYYSEPWNLEDERNDERLYPLVVYLHSSGVCDFSPEKAYEWMPAFYSRTTRANYPSFIFTPFADPDIYTDYPYEWKGNKLDDVLDVMEDLLSTYTKIDPSRIYFYGFSMGGAGVMRLAERYYERDNDKVAAIIKLSGHSPAYNDEEIDLIFQTAIWSFIGNDEYNTPETIADGTSAVLYMTEILNNYASYYSTGTITEETGIWIGSEYPYTTETLDVDSREISKKTIFEGYYDASGDYIEAGHSFSSIPFNDESVLEWFFEQKLE